MPDILSSLSKNRHQLLLDGLGIKSEPFRLSLLANFTGPSTQDLVGAPIGLFAGDQITGIAVAVGTTGSSLTLVKVGLYDSSGNRLAVSADASSSFNSGTGIKQTAFTTVYVVPSDGLYYACLLQVGTTPATLARGTSTSSAGALSGAAKPSVIQTGQTDLPASATFAATATFYWLGAY